MHKFNPENIDKLHSEERRKILPPEKTLIESGLKTGMTMVDIGCGSGYFAIPGAKIVGKNGKVIAVDIQKEMLDKLKQNNPPENIQIILAPSDYSFPIENETSDFTLLAFVTHENSDLEKFFNEIKRITKKDGRIVILEWKKQKEEKGPPFEERLDRNELVSFLNKMKFKIIENSELNESHYKLICMKP